MPNRYPAEQRQRVTRMALGATRGVWLGVGGGPGAGAKAWGWFGDVAQVGAAGPGRRWAAAGADQLEELAEIKRLKKENAELREADEILKAASVFIRAGLNP